MKLITLSLFLLVVACDTPTRARFPTSSSSNGFGTPTQGFTPTTPPTTGGATSGVTGGTNLGTGFENCNLAKNNYIFDPTATCVEKQANPSAPCPARIGICKSSIDELQIKFVSSLNSTAQRTCVVPMNGDEYLGDPQCLYTTAEAVVTGRLFKTRSGYTNRPVTGVTILTEGVLQDFYICQNAVQQYANAYCGGNPNNCLSQALNFRSVQCTNFNSRYANYFRLIQLN
jgi:hypothetical protein